MLLVIVFNIWLHSALCVITSLFYAASWWTNNSRSKSGPQTGCCAYFVHCLHVAGRWAVPGLVKNVNTLHWTINLQIWKISWVHVQDGFTLRQQGWCPGWVKLLVCSLTDGNVNADETHFWDHKLCFRRTPVQSSKILTMNSTSKKGCYCSFLALFYNSVFSSSCRADTYNTRVYNANTHSY